MFFGEVVCEMVGEGAAGGGGGERAGDMCVCFMMLAGVEPAGAHDTFCTKR